VSGDFQRPDFSGVWRLNLEKSTLRGQAPNDLLVQIEHREPALVQTLLIVASDGTERRERYTFDSSGAESENATPGGTARTRATWNGSELVIESVLNTPSRTFRFKDHWSLSDDHQTLRMAHVDDDLAGQVAVLEKASLDAADRFNR
jgi:hypothetical protein